MGGRSLIATLLLQMEHFERVHQIYIFWHMIRGESMTINYIAMRRCVLFDRWRTYFYVKVITEWVNVAWNILGPRDLASGTLYKKSQRDDFNLSNDSPAVARLRDVVSCRGSYD